jgi:CRISPR-associated exonuclease Cas4
MIPLSALNHFLYCPRRAALIHVEGIFEENRHTVLGELAHEHADLPGYEAARGVTLLRALPVFSERLGLNGKCDIVEVQFVGDEVTSPTHSDSAFAIPHSALAPAPPHVGSYSSLAPVEYKKGKRRAFANDDAQLCAQALCLEEMFGVSIPRGAVFHAASKRRRDVEFSAGLRKLTEDAVGALHRLVASGSVPAAVFKPACEECSLFEICLPKATGEDSRAQRLAGQLFQT